MWQILLTVVHVTIQVSDRYQGKVTVTTNLFSIYLQIVTAIVARRTEK